MNTKHLFCIARPNDISCNYPIGVVISGKDIDYTDDNPESQRYGHPVEECPGCGRRFQPTMSWDGFEPEIGIMLGSRPEPMDIIFPG